MRWLLVVLTLAGLGLPHSGHCDDRPTPHPGPVAATGHAEFFTGEVVTEWATGHHEDCPTSMTTVRACRPPVSAVAAASAAAVFTAIYGAHDVRVVVEPALSSGRATPALSLESLGVSRT